MGVVDEQGGRGSGLGDGRRRWVGGDGGQPPGGDRKGSRRLGERVACDEMRDGSEMVGGMVAGRVGAALVKGKLQGGAARQYLGGRGSVEVYGISTACQLSCGIWNVLMEGRFPA